MIRKLEKPRHRQEEGDHIRQDWKDEWKLEVKGHKVFLEVHKALREEILKRWQRALPFNEELFDRWERARFLGFGKGTSVYDSCIVFGDVKVGENTWIGPFTVLDGSGGLEIGSSCSISAGVHIYTHNTVAWALTGGKVSYERKPVKIGDRCYIGPHATISQGIKIGSCAIVGANSFLREDVGSHTMVAGNPAILIGRVLIRDGRVIIKRR